MNWGGPIFVIAIIAITTMGWMFTTWVRAKHGYPLENDWGDSVEPGGSPDRARQVELLCAENEKLQGKIGHLEERLAVLERIATDPAERTAREIDALR